MKKSKCIIFIMFIIVLLIPITVFATNENLQLVKTENDYIIYIKGIEEVEFDFAISNKENATEIELDYVNSIEDEEKNQVAFLTIDKYNNELKVNGKSYIYLKTIDGVRCKELDFEDLFDKTKMEEVEKTTYRIGTKVITDIIEQDEEVNGVKTKTTVGGLEITDSKEAEYFYSITKLPISKYSELMELAEKINKEYNKINMYSRIELAKQFYKLYTELIIEQNWIKVENLTIMQPNDAQTGEQYVVYIKKVTNNGEETIDVKLMTSYRKDEEEKIPARTETKVVQETAKLPITGDSFILFALLGTIILITIIVFIRIKKLENKKKKD